MNVADVLERAADVMDARGHAKLSYIDYDGSCCIKGALWLATHDNDERFGDDDPLYKWKGHPAEAAVLRAEPYYHDKNMRSSKDETVAFLRACAAVERARAAVAETVAA